MYLKKSAFWILLVIAIIVAIDFLFGVVFKHYLSTHTLPGDYEMTDHVLRHFDEDILVLGSSVALNGINTKTIEDSLGVKTFNGAANGQQFPFYLTMLKAAVARNKPKTVILGLSSNNLSNTGIGQRYNFLAPFYGNNIADIDSTMHGGDSVEKFLLNSSFYRLNRIWFRIMLYNFVSAGIKGENGFIAKPIPPLFPEAKIADLDTVMTDERSRQIEEFIEICKTNDINLTIVLNPRYIDPNHDTELMKQLSEICSKYGVTLYDDVDLEPFASDEKLFYDTNHINIDGSKIYTDTIINRLKWNS